MILNWLRVQQSALVWTGILSIITFVGTLLIIPVLVVRIPADYFNSKPRSHDCPGRRRSVIGLVCMVLKNLLGITFVLAGLAMLVLPGQGIITILIGIMLVNFPGKSALGLRIVRQPRVFRAINWMRAKANRPALEVSGPEHIKDVC